MNIQLISSGNREIFPFAKPIGIGMIESSINLTRLCLFDKPDLIIFIGSAGSYGNLKPFDIITTSIASNIENCFFEKKCYTPIDNVISMSEKPQTIINSSNYITTNEEIAKKYLKLNIEAENMEFFSVLKVAQEFEISVKGIFVITNYCNKSAHEDYMKNISKAKEKLINYLIEKNILKEKNG